MSARLHFSHSWKICILEKQATEVILVGWFGKCQSIKKVGGRRFVKGFYQALFSFRLVRRNVIFKAKKKIEPDLRLGQRYHPLMNKAPISLSRVVSTCFVNLFCWIYIDSIESILFESMSTPPRPKRVFASSATLVAHWLAFSIECVVDSFIDVCPNSVCYCRFCCF